MRILIDMDQVLCQWVERVLEWYNEDKGTSWTRDEITTWDVKQNLGPNSDDFIRSSMRYPEFYRDLLPIEGAIYGMKRLMKAGHDVIIASAVPKSAGIAYAGKMEWLRRNLPEFPLNNFVAIHRKDLLQGDLLVDDGLHNIAAFARTGRSTVIFDAPWNRNPTYDVASFGYNAPHRVRHWNQLLAHVEALANGEKIVRAVQDAAELLVAVPAKKAKRKR